MKFNVDGSSKGKPGPAGIGGVLRDSLAVVKIVFSKTIGVADSNVAELLAVREAMCIFVSLKWIHSHRMIIESDSSNVVRRILNPNSMPWKLKIFMSHIKALKLQLGSWQKVQIPRECNDVADALAKSDVFHRNILMVKYD